MTEQREPVLSGKHSRGRQEPAGQLAEVRPRLESKGQEYFLVLGF